MPIYRASTRLSGQLGLSPGIVQPITNIVTDWLGNVFGGHGRPYIQDIEAQLAVGETVSAYSWGQAGLPPDGGEWYRQWKIAHGIYDNPEDDPNYIPEQSFMGLPVSQAGMGNYLMIGAALLGAYLIFKGR